VDKRAEHLSWIIEGAENLGFAVQRIGRDGRGHERLQFSYRGHVFVVGTSSTGSDVNGWAGPLRVVRRKKKQIDQMLDVKVEPKPRNPETKRDRRRREIARQKRAAVAYASNLTTPPLIASKVLRSIPRKPVLGPLAAQLVNHPLIGRLRSDKRRQRLAQQQREQDAFGKLTRPLSRTDLVMTSAERFTPLVGALIGRGNAALHTANLCRLVQAVAENKTLTLDVAARLAVGLEMLLSLADLPRGPTDPIQHQLRLAGGSVLDHCPTAPPAAGRVL
jgi:hypothetical protein